MPDEIEAFARRKEVQRDRDELDNLVEAARSGGPQKCFQLGEGELDRIEVRAVGRQEAQPRTDAFNRRFHLRLFVHREVIEDDDVAGAERRDEHLLDIGEKRGIIDRPVEDGGRRQPLDPQRGHDRVRLPMAVRRVIAETDPARTPAIAAQQIGRDAGFIDEDVAARIVQAEGVLPLPPARGDINATLFVGEYRFF
jgi:hypothetical protein